MDEPGGAEQWGRRDPRRFIGDQDIEPDATEQRIAQHSRCRGDDETTILNEGLAVRVLFGREQLPDLFCPAQPDNFFFEFVKLRPHVFRDGGLRHEFIDARLGDIEFSLQFGALTLVQLDILMQRFDVFPDGLQAESLAREGGFHTRPAWHSPL